MVGMPVKAKRQSTHGVPGTRRSPARPQSRRRDIVDHAIRLMEEKGFAAMSVQHVADALEFSKANFYHHVDSKENLLYEIFVDTLEHSIRQIDDVLGSGRSTPDKLRALVDFYVSMMTGRRAVMLVWFKERAHLSAAHLDHVSQLERRITGMLDRFYGEGMEEGCFKRMDVDVLRLSVFGMCFQLTKLPRSVDRAAIATISLQLQDLASTGILCGTDRAT